MCGDVCFLVGVLDCPVQDVGSVARFTEEYGSSDVDEAPEETDFAQTFHGNIDGAVHVAISCGFATPSRRFV